MLKHTKRQGNEFLFSKMRVIVMFVTAVCYSDMSSEKRCPTSMADWHTNFPRFQVARPDHVQSCASRKF